MVHTIASVLSFHFQIAAELDRSETARMLVEQGSHAGVRDINGLSALVLMITKMPSVVRIYKSIKISLCPSLPYITINLYSTSFFRLKKHLISFTPLIEQIERSTIS